MRVKRSLGSVAATLLIVGTSTTGLMTPIATSAASARTATVRIQKQLPAPLARGRAHFMGRVSPNKIMHVNFGLPIRNANLVTQTAKAEAASHQYMTHQQVFAKFAPTVAQFRALQSWVKSNGMPITHLTQDRTMVATVTTAAKVESVLHVSINWYQSLGRTFYSNAQAPTVPTTLGIRSITGLNNFDRYHTDHVRAGRNAPALPAIAPAALRKHNGIPQPQFRTGGYFPSDLRALYDMNGYMCGANPCDGTGQTLGFTLWGPAVNQTTFNAFTATTGDPLITVDTTNGIQTGDATVKGTCVGTVGAGPHTGQSCVDFQESANQIMYVLDGPATNSKSQLPAGGTVETGLDIESAHGMAQNAAMKYYIGGDGGFNADLELAMSDAGSDPTLRTISNSWGEDADYNSVNDPFYIATTQEFQLAALAGTTFYFSSGDGGNNNDGAPSDNQWDVSVGGTGIYSPGANNVPPGANNVWSTSLDWGNSGAGSACSMVVPRPFWQTGIGNAASCAGRATPDVSMDADPSTGFNTFYNNQRTATANNTAGTDAWAGGTVTLTFASASTPAEVGGVVTVAGFSPPAYNGSFTITGSTSTSVSYSLAADPGNILTDGTAAYVITQSSQIGGTSLAVPLMNGFMAVLNNYIASQTYPGATPTIGFAAPVIYALGNSRLYNHYYRDVTCGMDSNPAGGPDGDHTGQGWDQATGFGDMEWHSFSQGVAQLLGSTNQSTPSSNLRSYNWSCAPYAMNLSVRGLSCSTTTCYGGGSAASNSFAPQLQAAQGGTWRLRPTSANMQFNKSTDGGVTWEATNPDMYGVTCTSNTACIQVGDEGRIRTTSDGGATWTERASPMHITLFSVTCPSSSICYAAGDQGYVIKSTDGGATWTLLTSGIGNTIYDISCVSTSKCFASDWFGVFDSTSDGGATWTDNFNGDIINSASNLSSGITCPTASACYMTSYDLNGASSPIDFSSDGGNTWTFETTGTGRNIDGITCVSADECYAVGANGTILHTTNGTAGAGATWTIMPSGTTATLVGISCSSASSCVAVGSAATVDTLSAGLWIPATVAAATGNLLNAVNCSDATHCIATGAQSMTIATTDGVNWSQQLGGGVGSTGTGQPVFAMACPSASQCLAVTNTSSGNTSPFVIRTANGGGIWARKAVPTTTSLNGISCVSTSVCVAVGSAASALPAAIDVSTDGGLTWTSQTSNTGNGTANNLNWVSCQMGTTLVCLAADADGKVDVNSDVLGAGTWALATTGNSNALLGIQCNSTTSCIAVGNLGTILTTGDGGATWTPRSNPFSGISTLMGIGCTNDASQCYADGNWGTVLSSTDGGATWTQQATPLSGPLSALNNGGGQNNLLSVACNTTCILGGQQGSILVPQVTVTVHASGTYGSTPALSNLAPSNAAISYNPSGEAANITGTLTCSTNATAASPVSGNPYTIASCSGLADTGRTIFYDYESSDYTVNPAPLTITTVTGSSVYGTAPGTVSPKYIGLVNGDTGTATAPTCSTTATASSPVGSYPASCSGASDPNYNISYVDGTWNVTKAALTLTADNKSAQYGTTPTFTFTGTGYVNGDTNASLTTQPTCTSTATDGAGKITSPTGSYPITCSGATSANYAIGYAPGTLTVTLAKTTLTYSGPSSVKHGTMVTLKAKLTATTGGSGVAGRKIRLSLRQGKNHQSCLTGPTSSNGAASCALPNKLGFKAGSSTAYGTFAGDPLGASHDYSSSTTKMTVKVK